MARKQKGGTPCVYRFDWSQWNDEPSLTLSIFQRAIEGCNLPTLSGCLLTQKVAGYNHLPCCFPIDDTDFGFLHCFKARKPPINLDYLSWKADLSQLPQEDTDSYYQRLRAIVATLYLTTWHCNSLNLAFSTDHDQLMVVSLSTKYNRGVSEGYINALVTFQMSSWLVAFFDDSMNQAVREAMISAWRAMHPDTDTSQESCIYSKIDPPQVCLELPGQASHTYTESIRDDRCVSIGDHNIDTPRQILTLLIGLTTLCNLAREKIR